MLTNVRVFFKIVYILFSAIVLKRDHGIFHKACDLCGGVIHTKLESNHLNGIYTAKFQCKQCGAIGDLKEEWAK